MRAAFVRRRSRDGGPSSVGALRPERLAKLVDERVRLVSRGQAERNGCRAVGMSSDRPRERLHGASPRASHTAATRGTQVFFEPAGELKGKLRMPGLIGCDALHVRAEVMVGGAMSLHMGDGCGVRLAHAAFDGILYGHGLEPAPTWTLDSDIADPRPGALRELLHDCRVANLVASGTPGRREKTSRRPVLLELMCESDERENGGRFEMRDLREKPSSGRSRRRPGRRPQARGTAAGAASADARIVARDLLFGCSPPIDVARGRGLGARVRTETPTLTRRKRAVGVSAAIAGGAAKRERERAARSVCRLARYNPAGTPGTRGGLSAAASEERGCKRKRESNAPSQRTSNRGSGHRVSRSASHAPRVGSVRTGFFLTRRRAFERTSGANGSASDPIRHTCPSWVPRCQTLREPSTLPAPQPTHEEGKGIRAPPTFT